MRDLFAINIFICINEHFCGTVYGARSRNLIDDNARCLWSFLFIRQVPPQKNKTERDLTAHFTRCQAQCSSQILLLDEHGLSNLCHRNAIYISVCCFVLFEINRTVICINFCRVQLYENVCFFPSRCAQFF